MALRNYLFALGGVAFPLKYIYKESYKVAPQPLDLDSTRNTSGWLQRNVLEHESIVISFATRPMDNEMFSAMWEFIRSKWTNKRERKVQVSYYDPETDSYESATCYVPVVEHNMDMVNIAGSNKKITYLSETIEFIGY